jgi:hypothetical protein
LKDLGKKLFAFSKLEMPAETIIGMTVIKDGKNDQWSFDNVEQNK